MVVHSVSLLTRIWYFQLGWQLTTLYDTIIELANLITSPHQIWSLRTAAVDISSQPRLDNRVLPLQSLFTLFHSLCLPLVWEIFFSQIDSNKRVGDKKVVHIHNIPDSENQKGTIFFLRRDAPNIKQRIFFRTERDKSNELRVKRRVKRIWRENKHWGLPQKVWQEVL